MTISVCIPTYNQAQYLKTSILSAYNQTYKPSEIIVSNDCSTDSTKQVLEDISKIVPILKIINQDKNLGMCGNTNFCLQQAQGDFIIKLDSDDYLHTNYAERLVALLNKYPRAAYAHGNVQEIDQNGEFVQKRILFRKKEFIDWEEALFASIKGYQVAANIIMFRRAALVDVNFLENRPKDFAEDFHLSADLAAHGWGNAFVSELLSYYRVWTDSGNVRAKRKLVEVEGLTRVFKDIFEPIFLVKGYPNDVLEKQKAKFAQAHANSLGWKEYSSDEKNNIKMALLKLSSSKATKIVIWLYKNEFGSILNLKAMIVKNLKKIIKKIVH